MSTEVIYIEDKAYYKLERARGVREDTEIQFLTVDTSTLPLDLFPGIETFDFEKRSLYDVMRKEYGIYPSIVEISIRPQIIDRRISELFVVDEGMPLLMAEGQVLSEDNLLVELTQVIYSPNVVFKLGTRINTI